MSAPLTGWQAVCRTDELLPGEHAVCFDGDTAILVCNVDGELYALAAPLQGAEIECVLHGARFDVRTGQALCAPAYAPAPKFPVRVEDGVIYTRDDR